MVPGERHLSASVEYILRRRSASFPCFRETMAKGSVSLGKHGSPADDAIIFVLEDHRDDPVVQEIAAAIFSMSEDEQIDLVPLAWLGRGDGSIEDWDELRAEAARS